MTTPYPPFRKTARSMPRQRLQTSITTRAQAVTICILRRREQSNPQHSTAQALTKINSLSESKQAPKTRSQETSRCIIVPSQWAVRSPTTATSVMHLSRSKTISLTTPVQPTIRSLRTERLISIERTNISTTLKTSKRKPKNTAHTIQRSVFTTLTMLAKRTSSEVSTKVYGA